MRAETKQWLRYQRAKLKAEAREVKLIALPRWGWLLLVVLPFLAGLWLGAAWGD